jgi:hypothetical protein
MFSMAPRKIAVYYGANLLGSGSGALAGILLLYLWHPLVIPRILALLLTVVAALFMLPPQFQDRSRHNVRTFPATLAFSAAGLAAVVLLGWAVPLDPAMSQYKALSRTQQLPATEVLLEEYSPLGVTNLVQGPTLRAAAGLSLSYGGIIRPQIAAFIDGNPVGVVPLLDDTLGSAPLRHSSQALAYQLRPASDDGGNLRQVLVLNAGAGSEVHQALMHGSNLVTAVVRDGNMLDMFGHLSRIKAGQGDVYVEPRVETAVTDARSFLYRGSQQYNLIMIPPLGGILNTATAMRSIHEENLLTEEGIVALMQRLTPDGILCLSTPLDNPPRRPIKLFGLLAAAHRQSASDKSLSSSDHLAAIGSWNMFTILYSQQPWTSEERARIIDFAANEGFDLLYLPGHRDSMLFHELADSSLVTFLKVLASSTASRPAIPSPFNLIPPTDNRPYFYHFITLRSIPLLHDTLGRSGIMLAEWGYVLLWITLALLIIVGAILILIPLWINYGRLPTSRKNALPAVPQLSLWYFGVIGFGFMLIEIVIIQKLVLILGDPTFAAAGAITALLVFAGLGSILSGHKSRYSPYLVPAAAGLVLLILATMFFAISHFAVGLAGLSDIFRFALVTVCLLPLAMALGIFFPTGIGWLKAAQADHIIPWAWGINGFASVIAAPVATIVALNLGFIAVASLAILCYLAAAAITFSWWANDSYFNYFEGSRTGE